MSISVESGIGSLGQRGLEGGWYLLHVTVFGLNSKQADGPLLIVEWMWEVNLIQALELSGVVAIVIVPHGKKGERDEGMEKVARGTGAPVLREIAPAMEAGQLRWYCHTAHDTKCTLDKSVFGHSPLVQCIAGASTSIQCASSTKVIKQPEISPRSAALCWN